MWWGRMENMFKKYSGTAEGAPVPDKPCAGKHMDHLCAIAARADFKQVAALAAQPNYVCMNCGRVAGSQDNLCNPIAMNAVVMGSLHAA